MIQCRLHQSPGAEVFLDSLFLPDGPNLVLSIDLEVFVDGAPCNESVDSSDGLGVVVMRLQNLIWRRKAAQGI
jgi:hypothetical protein